MGKLQTNAVLADRRFPTGGRRPYLETFFVSRKNSKIAFIWLFRRPLHMYRCESDLPELCVKTRLTISVLFTLRPYTIVSTYVRFVQTTITHSQRNTHSNISWTKNTKIKFFFTASLFVIWIPRDTLFSGINVPRAKSSEIVENVRARRLTSETHTRLSVDDDPSCRVKSDSKSEHWKKRKSDEKNLCLSLARESCDLSCACIYIYRSIYMCV